MPEPLYFQWQNEILLKTIYPMREVKLRDFLGFYAEVDIWKQYKDKDIATLSAEVKTYEAAQAKMAEAAYAEYKKHVPILIPRLRPWRPFPRP